MPEDNFKSERPASASSSAEVETQHSRLIYPHAEDPGSAEDDLVRAWKKAKRGVQVAIKTWKPLDWAAFIIPAVGWLKSYKWTLFIVSQLVQQ